MRTESSVKTTDFDESLYQKRTLSTTTNVNLYYRIIQVDLSFVFFVIKFC